MYVVHQNDVAMSGHIIMIMQPERFPKSDRHRKSMTKLTPNEPAVISEHYTSPYTCFSGLPFSIF